MIIINFLGQAIAIRTTDESLKDRRGKPGSQVHISHKRFRCYTQSVAEKEDLKYNMAHTFQHQMMVLGETAENKRRLLGRPLYPTIYFTKEGIRTERDTRPMDIVAEPLIISNNQLPISRPRDLMSIPVFRDFAQKYPSENGLQEAHSTPQLSQTSHPDNIDSDDDEHIGPMWAYSARNPEGFVIEPLILPITPPRRRRDPEPDDEEDDPPFKTPKLELKSEKQ